MSFDVYDSGNLFTLLIIFTILIIGAAAILGYLTYSEKVQSCSEEGLEYSSGKCWEHSGNRVITYELQVENEWAFIPQYKVNKFPSVEN